MTVVVRMTVDPPIPTDAGAEHVGVFSHQAGTCQHQKREASATRWSASRMKGERHPLPRASCEALRIFLHMDGSVE